MTNPGFGIMTNSWVYYWECGGGGISATCQVEGVVQVDCRVEERGGPSFFVLPLPLSVIFKIQTYEIDISYQSKINYLTITTYNKKQIKFIRTIIKL